MTLTACKCPLCSAPTTAFNGEPLLCNLCTETEADSCNATAGKIAPAPYFQGATRAR